MALLLVQLLLLIVITVVDIVVVWVTVPAFSTALAANLTAAAGLHFCYIMLVFLLSLAVTLFAGQLTANSMGQVLMTVVLHVSVPLIGLIFMSIAGAFNNTIGQVGLMEHLTRFNILTGFMRSNGNAVVLFNMLNPALSSSEDASSYPPLLLVWPLVTTIIYIVLIALLFAATYALYQRRAVEKTGDTLIYPHVGSVIKAVYVFLGAVLCGLFFREMITENIVGLVIGAVIAMIVVHMIAEMVYSMDVDGVRRHYISTIVGLVVALAVMLGFQSGVLSLDQRLPDASSVKGAILTSDNASNRPTEVSNRFASDPEVIEKVMTAAEQAKEKNYVVKEDEENIPNLTTLTLTYKTFFGQNTRNYTLTEEDAQAIMTPLLNDAKVSQATWANLMDADINDILEMTYSIGGYSTYLIQMPQNKGTVQANTSLVKDEKDGLRRAGALLKAVQSDLGKRSADVYQTRVIGSIMYSALTKDAYGQNSIDWSDNLTLYEGDTATAALLNQWREEGFLENESDLLNEMLGRYEVGVYHPNEEASRANLMGTVSLDDFIAAYLAGDIMTDNQVINYGADVQDDILLVLSDGPADDETAALVGNFYLRKDAELNIQPVS